MTYKQLKSSDIFTCKTCGDCCTGYGGTYVSENDMKRIADYIKVSVSDLKSKYLEISSSGKYVIVRGENGKCVFADKLCGIHPVKPDMCKAWPFINSVITNPENWNIMAGACPGIKKNIPVTELIRCVEMEIQKRKSED